jgi:hypothetical protein
VCYCRLCAVVECAEDGVSASLPLCCWVDLGSEDDIQVRELKVEIAFDDYISEQKQNEVLHALIGMIRYVMIKEQVSNGIAIPDSSYIEWAINRYVHKED